MPPKKHKISKVAKAELKAFSQSPVKTVCEKLGLEKFTRETFDSLEIEVDPLSDDELDKLYDNIRRAWLSKRTKIWREAKVRAFVDRVLESVVLELLPKFETAVDDEADIIGQENHGRADMAITSGDAILLIVEIKASDIDTAVAQCLLEMEAAHEQNMVNKIDLGDTMFGIATTGDQWALVKAIFGADKPIVSMTDIMYLSVKRKKLVKSTMTKQLERLHGKITRVLVEQAEKYKSAVKSV
jgi:hypothetical protein